MDLVLTFEISILILLIGSVITFFMGKHRKSIGLIALSFMTLAAVGIYYVVINVFLNGPAESLSLWTVPILDSSLVLKIDHLSALFLAIIALVSVLVSLYSLKFMNLEDFKEYSLRGYYPILLLFFAGVMCVVTVTDMFFFFIFWEVMTMASYFMVIFQKREKKNLQAGFKYFFITHVATALLFIASIILFSKGGSFAFDKMSETMQMMATQHSGLLHLVLLFFFLGFATKAGILPMGDWLPDAYPAAPAPASAAFAGSMTKLGIYGIVRIFCDILPASSYSNIWGIIIAIMGTVSIFVGTVTALVQNDSKRLLSFHVIGQMGYMFLGIGIGVAFMATNPVIAIVAIGAGIFHLVNHVCYKSCLFFNAGSVYYKVGTQDLNKIGGLYSLMPLTAITTIIASLAIAGIPPFSGFSSKWLIYQASVKAGLSNPLMIALGICALFISAVTLASFIKFFSSMYFGKYADNNSNAVKGDVPLSMKIPQIVLAFLCVFFGVLPMLPIHIVFSALEPILKQNVITFTGLYGAGTMGGITLNFGNGVFAAWNPVLILIVAFICLAISFFFFRAGKAPRRQVDTWYCGELHDPEEVRYEAHNFYLPFKKLFRLRIGQYEQEGIYPKITIPKLSLTNKNILYRLAQIDEWFYQPLVNKFLKCVRSFSALHSGIPHIYLLWLVLGAIAAVIVLFTLSANGV